MMVGWLTDRLTHTQTGNYCGATLLSFSRKHPYVRCIHTLKQRTFRRYRQLVPKYDKSVVLAKNKDGEVHSTPGSVRVRHCCVHKMELRSESGNEKVETV